MKHIATTQFSPELNSLDWGGSIIAKINHATPPPPHHHVITFVINTDMFRAMECGTE